jgi:hypothetical protein
MALFVNLSRAYLGGMFCFLYFFAERHPYMYFETRGSVEKHLKTTAQKATG